MSCISTGARVEISATSHIMNDDFSGQHKHFFLNFGDQTPLLRVVFPYHPTPTMQPCEGGFGRSIHNGCPAVGIAIPKMVLVTARPLITLGVDGLNIWQKKVEFQ